MSQPPPPTPGLGDRVRDSAENFGANWRTWREDVSKDPTLLWRTPAVRIGLWVILAVIVFVVARFLLTMWAPSGPSAAIEEATREATLYVACTNAGCRASYTTHQPRDFKEWPIECQKCRQIAVYRAKLCKQCRSWYATRPANADECPFCAEKKATSKPARPVERVAPTNPHDRDDGW